MAAKPAGAIAPVFAVAGAALGAVTAVPFLRAPDLAAAAVTAVEQEAAAHL